MKFTLKVTTASLLFLTEQQPFLEDSTLIITRDGSSLKLPAGLLKQILSQKMCLYGFYLEIWAKGVTTNGDYHLKLKPKTE